jgi:TetR/AcrR family transcriptional regulator, tetracycline repressor protein
MGVRQRPTAGARRRRGPGQRAGLVSETVLREARTLSRNEGIEHLTMRRLAERLGVAPNALYSHFADKGALLDALMDSLLVDVEVPDITRVDWREGLLELMRSTRRFLLANADLIQLFLARPRRGPNAIRLGEATLTLLAHAGLEGEEAVHALRILLIYTFGFSAQEGPRLADPEREERTSRNEAAFEAAREYPRMRKLAKSLSEHPGDDTFERGLHWLLDGIRAMARHA